MADTLHKFASTQINLTGDAAAAMLGFARAIPNDEIDPTDGRESEPHVTVKYGLHTSDPHDVARVLDGEPPITVTLGKTSIFTANDNRNSDVVKLDVTSPDLHRLNAKIADALPHTDTYPDYHPHATVAYVKPGMGKKYDGHAALEGKTFTIDRIIFSAQDGTKTQILLNGKPPISMSHNYYLLTADAGHWVTIDGAHVHIGGDGKIDKGPAHLVGKNPEDAGKAQKPTSRITETPQFKKWFGDSKVVGAQGQPLVVYHGTKAAFETFDTKHFGASDEGLAGKGFYFTYNPEEASGYAINEQYGKGDAPNIQPVYVSIKNPFIITHGVLPDGRKIQELHKSGINSGGGNAVRKIAEDGGHDGILFASRDGAVRHVVAWKPEQIKSAIGNRGTFDPKQKDITMARTTYYLSTSAPADLKPAVTLGQGYPTHLKVKVGNEDRQVPVAYFWKDTIQAGDYVHPATNQKLNVDAGRIDGWVDKFHQMRAAGIEIPTPTDHSHQAKDNLGFVVDAKRNGDRLSLLHQVIGEDAAMTALRNRCSLCIEPDYVDEKGRKWGDVFTHSAFTPVPVVSGMGSFVPFAASRDRQTETPIFYLSADERNPDMDFKQLREALGATADVPDDQLLTKVKELKTSAATALSRATAAETKVTELDAKVITLSRTPTPPDPEALRDRMELSIGKIDLAIAKGDLTPAIADKLKAKVGTLAAPNAFMLSRSADLGDRPVDFLLSLFEGAQLAPRTGSQTGLQLLSRETPGGETDKPVNQEDIKARAAAIGALAK